MSYIEQLLSFSSSPFALEMGTTHPPPRVILRSGRGFESVERTLVSTTKDTPRRYRLENWGRVSTNKDTVVDTRRYLQGVSTKYLLTKILIRFPKILLVDTGLKIDVAYLLTKIRLVDTVV